MDRRRFIVSAAAGGAGLAAGGFTASARAADTPTDDELAFANFGLAAEFLLEDFYARVAGAKLASAGAYAREVARGALNASEHATALAKLLTGAGQSAAGKEDFAFAWPEGTFASERAAAAAGLIVTRALLGAYVSATAAISIPSYRQLYASMGANVAQQVAWLSQWGGARTIGVSFPPAIDLETANAAIEAYLG